MDEVRTVPSNLHILEDDAIGDIPEEPEELEDAIGDIDDEEAPGQDAKP